MIQSLPFMPVAAQPASLPIQSLPSMPVAAQPASWAGRALRRSAHVTDGRKPWGV